MFLRAITIIIPLLTMMGCAAAVPFMIQAAPVVLDAAAQIACSAQAQANQQNQSELSKAVGVFCKW